MGPREGEVTTGGGKKPSVFINLGKCGNISKTRPLPTFYTPYKKQKCILLSHLQGDNSSTENSLEEPFWKG